MEAALEISPQEAREKLGRGQIALIDVREPAEHAIACVEGSELIPMQNIPAELQKLEAIADERTVAVMCHHGVRSLNVVVWLRQHGLESAVSVAGGIDRWSQEVDSNIPRY